MVPSVHVVLVVFYHLNHIFMMGTSNLINHDFIIVQDRMSYQSRGFYSENRNFGISLYKEEQNIR